MSEFTTKLVAGVLPKVTAVAPVNPEPKIDTAVPPVSGPAIGDTLVTIGALNRRAVVEQK
ncbi:MAG: hypothetical protein HWD61_07425 [Parachlamydiaceae bacterium]|nr:MAG: hypothetical protein HWD61_07425 [Parachlamydiaceae bacterium]